MGFPAPDRRVPGHCGTPRLLTRNLRSPATSGWVTAYSNVTEIGDREIASIEAEEIVKLVLRIEAKGATDVARRMLQIISSIFFSQWFCVFSLRGGPTLNSDLEHKTKPHRSGARLILVIRCLIKPPSGSASTDHAKCSR